jgi:hypothetical protein
MPKHFKKPKGVEAHQHVAGEDFSEAEPWVREAIAQGRIVIEGEEVGLSITGLLLPVPDTHWIVLNNETGELLTMSDAQFQASYQPPGTAPAPVTG